MQLNRGVFDDVVQLTGMTNRGVGLTGLLKLSRHDSSSSPQLLGQSIGNQMIAQCRTY
jgi:hypothetical protein